MPCCLRARFHLLRVNKLWTDRRTDKKCPEGITGIMIILPTLRTPTLVHAHLISEQQAQGTTLEPQTYVTQSMDSQTVTAVVAHPTAQLLAAATGLSPGSVHQAARPCRRSLYRRRGHRGHRPAHTGWHLPPPPHFPVLNPPPYLARPRAHLPPSSPPQERLPANSTKLPCGGRPKRPPHPAPLRASAHRRDGGPVGSPDGAEAAGAPGHPRHDPRELRQCLERLSVLPMTGDILADTGVRKTVRGLRKHQLVGSLAKELAARWKILALLDREARPEHRVAPGERPADALPGRRQHGETDAQRELGPPGKRAPSPEGATEHGRKRPREAPAPSSDFLRLQAPRGGSAGPPQVARHPSTSPREPGPAAPADISAVGGTQASHEGPGLRPRPSTEKEFQEPASSFQACLHYEEPPKKKKAPGKTSATSTLAETQPTRGASQSGPRDSDLLGKLPKVKGHEEPQKPQPAEADAAKLEKVSSAAAAMPPPALPFPGRRPAAVPFPPSTPAPLPRTGSGSAVLAPRRGRGRPRRRGRSSGRGRGRTRARGRIYWGSVFQDARVFWLQAGLLPPPPLPPPQPAGHAGRDRAPGMLLGRSGNPDCLPEPAWETCSPAQLWRTQKSRHVPVEQTDRLWRRRCSKDFKGETPRERESWREMYLRLREARERRLQAVAARIQSAQAKKAHGRQTQMILFNPLAQPPDQIAGSSFSGASSASGNPGAQRPACASGSAARAPAPAPSVLAANTRKATAKKAAPLMAKTLRDYKHCKSRSYRP
uniref:RNA polymerase II transcription factor SIII subunit A2-like n=1 Tax=Castor canadensis TaxID=51338 RepID=A0A8B7TWL4_CASCN|nr:RNA polymerase II transcription factor SIII subunit A2-like [Castor canadensis]